MPLEDVERIEVIRRPVGATWKVTDRWAQNLLCDEHFEFLNARGKGFTNYLKRSACAKLIWRF
jgi:hypothetical protein